MSALRKAKEKLVQEITEKIQGSKSVYLFEYLGLTVSEITTLRNNLRAEGNEMKVYKNRFIKIAAKNAGMDGLDDSLLGPNAIVFSNEDEVSGARIIADLAKDKEFLKFKAGIFEGKVIDAEFVTELSQIPSRETLLTQIAAGLLQPLQQVAIGLDMLEESHVSGAGSAPVEAKEEETKTEEKPVAEAKEEAQVEATPVAEAKEEKPEEASAKTEEKTAEEPAK